MADTATEIKPAEIIAASRQTVEKPVFAAGATGDVKEAQDTLTASVEKTNKINEAREKDPSNLRTALEQVAAPPDFTNSQMEETATALGEDISSPDTITNALQPLAQYLEASRAAILKGTDITTELAAAGLTAADIQEKVSKILISRGRLLEKFPVLAKAFEGPANEAALNTFVEQALARDPRFQREMASVLTEIHKEAAVIEKPSEKSTEANKIREIQNDQIDSLRKRLRAEGVKEPAIKLILKDIEAGDASLTLNSTVEAIANAKGIKNIGWLDNYQRSSSALVQAEKELAQAQKSLANENAKKGNQRNEDLIASYTSQTNTFQEQVNQARASVNTTKQSYNETFGTQTDGKITDVFTKDLQELQNARAVLSEQNGINRTINFLHNNAQRLKEAERTVAAESGGDAGEREKKRKEDIAKLTQRLEASVDTAMSKFLQEKYDNYVADQTILMAASIKEAEAHNKDWKAGSLKKIQGVIDGWSEFKDGKYVRDRGKIGESIKDLADKSAYDKDGVRQIFAEKTGFELDPEKLKDDIAKEITPFSPNYNTLSAPAKKAERDAITFASLSPEQQAKANKIAEARAAEFEEIMAEQGEKFKERLFVEYNSSRALADKLGVGTLNLTKDQQAALEKAFSSLDKKLETGTLGKWLKEKGWNNRNPKTKLLLILLLLAGASLAAATAPIAVGAVGAASGAARDILP